MGFLTAASVAQEATALPQFVVQDTRVANDEPAGSMPMPVSALRFEPRVDVQARNLAEAQSDVSIRGGTFESTGVRVGAVPLADPQTGHYHFELPISPLMLGAPAVATGAENALRGFNAGSGTVVYGWAPVKTAGRVTLAGGQHGFNRQSLYTASRRDFGGRQAGADIELARSRAEGPVVGGDHHFTRAAGRVQWRTEESQTDLFVGYQAKFFGWPNLYTPFGFQESESLQTVLAVLNHTWRDQAGNEFSAAAFYRRNKDDYEFNRHIPGASNPFQHTTQLRGAALDGRVRIARAALGYGLATTWDHLDSTALTFGRFNARQITKASLVPEMETSVARGRVIWRGGVGFDHSDRDGGAWSPIASVRWHADDRTLWRLEYSETTQLPSYTALNSNPTAGLFRGNPDLQRARARNLEIGTAVERSGWSLEAAAFRRWEDRLVDWTYRRGVTARTANAVDVVTDGFELVASRRRPRYDVTLGYTWLRKTSDYGTAVVDASFYALNFPTHRFTAAVRWRLGGGLELRADNEYRVQADNYLRQTGSDHALLSAIGLYYLPRAWRGWEASVLVDNLWNSRFQEVPAVPASPRQVACGLSYRW